MSAIIDCPQVMSRGRVNVSGRTAGVRRRGRAGVVVLPDSRMTPNVWDIRTPLGPLGHILGNFNVSNTTYRLGTISISEET